MFRRFLVAALLLVAAALAALLVAPPAFVIRRVASLAAPRLLNGSPMGDSSWETRGSRILGMYVQMGIGAQLSDRLTATASSDDEALLRIVLFVRNHGLNQTQFDHVPRVWPALVSGLGYCDQINAAVATIAARRFEVAQIYATYDPVSRTTPHTIGRVWTESRGWLYYDAFYATPLLFTRDAAGRARFLDLRTDAPIPSRGMPADLSVYSLPGWVLADYHSSFAALLFSRATAAMRPQIPAERRGGSATTAPTPATPGATLTARPWLTAISQAGPAPLPPTRLKDDEAFSRVAREYMAIRISEVEGEMAGDQYRRLAADPAARLDDRAEYLAEIAGRLGALEVE